MLLFLHDFIMNIFVLWFYFRCISRHSLTSFVHCAENKKKKKENLTNSVRRLFTLWYDWNNFYVYFLPIYVLKVVFRIGVLYFNI